MQLARRGKRCLKSILLKNKNDYIELASNLNVPFDKIKIVEAFEKEKVIGYGAYYYDEDTLKIVAANANGDKYLYDGIIRTMLFLASVDFIDKAEFIMDDFTEVLELGFVNNSNNCINSIENFMNSCKNCKKSC